LNHEGHQPPHPRRKPLDDSEANAARVRLHHVLEMFDRIELEPEMLAQAGRLAGPRAHRRGDGHARSRAGRRG
jgi:hypothetical protein